MTKTWNLKFNQQDNIIVETLHQQLGIYKSVCQILANRNIHTYQEAQNFFRPSIADLHNPFLMKDMDKATNIIIETIQQNKKILLYGDYDVDGTSSIASLYSFLTSHFPHAQISYYIPNRLQDGYGLTQKGYDYIIQQNINLVITLDCGIKSTQYINQLTTQNIATIICDHHLPDEQNIPNAIAIINPLQKNCPYPFKDLCACGITFKLITVLLQKINADKKFLNTIIDLCALATSADIVPLMGENRILVFHGLKKMNTNAIACIRALKKVACIYQNMTNHQMVFGIAPHINAAGRMDSPDKAVQLLLETNFDKALHIAQELNSNNTERKKIDTSITIDANAIINQMPAEEEKFTCVIYQADWHKGVLGIIASRMVEAYHKPSIILTKTNNTLVGSARSIPGFNMVEALNDCSQYLTGHGGHYYAAGLQLHEQNLEAFKTAFEQQAQKIFNNKKPMPTIDIDAEINLSQCTLSYTKLLEQLEPYGPQNLRPIFLTQNVSISNIYSIKDKHLKFKVWQNNKSINAIFFNSATIQNDLEKTSSFNIIYSIERNAFKDQNEVQIIIIDINQTTDKL